VFALQVAQKESVHKRLPSLLYLLQHRILNFEDFTDKLPLPLDTFLEKMRERMQIDPLTDNMRFAVGTALLLAVDGIGLAIGVDTNIGDLVAIGTVPLRVLNREVVLQEKLHLPGWLLVHRWPCYKDE